MKKFEYSILQYFPSVIAGERINLGVLIHCMDDNATEFVYVDGRSFNSRLKSFDDELDISTVKTVLNLVSDDIKDIYNPVLSNDIPYFSISEYIKYFSNEYKFTIPMIMEYENMTEIKEELIGIYLRFYLSKSRRKNKHLEYDFMERLFRANNIEYNKNKTIEGSFNTKISYDYFIDSGNGIGIKIIYLNSKTLNKSINNIKAWAWNSNHNSLEKLIVIYVLEDGKLTKDIQNTIDLLKENNNNVYSIYDQRLPSKI